MLLSFWFRHLVYDCPLKHTEQSKAIPLQSWTGPEGIKRLRLLEFLHSRHMREASFNPTQLPPSPISRYHWYAFQLEAESTPSGIEPANFSTCSVVPQPTAYSYDILNFPIILVLPARIIGNSATLFFRPRH
jgi:hypothetical protein